MESRRWRGHEPGYMGGDLDSLMSGLRPSVTLKRWWFDVGSYPSVHGNVQWRHRLGGVNAGLVVDVFAGFVLYAFAGG